MQRQRRRGIQAAGMVGAMALLVIVLMPREHLLHQRSTRLASLEHCVATDSAYGSSSEGYGWLSNDDLLILRAKPLQNGLAQVEAYRHNIHMQQETPLADFNRKQASALVSRTRYPADATNPYERWGLDCAILSPDRQQLLWLRGKYNQWNWHVARLDGTTAADCKAADPHPNFSFVDWLPDSRQWVVTADSGPPELHFYSSEMGRLTAIKFLTLAQNLPPMAYLRDGRLLLTEPLNSVPLTVGEARWQDKQPVAVLHTINIPGIDSINEIAVSSDETRFALYCRLSQSASLSPFMLKLQQWLHVPDRHVWAICTCRMDGSDLREIGHLPESASPAASASATLSFTGIDVSPREAAALPHNIHWSPDDKHLCYCQGNALYMVPVE